MSEPAIPLTVSPITWKGRGARIAPQVRFDALKREAVDDGWGGSASATAAAGSDGDGDGTGGNTPAPPRTVVTPQTAKSIITRNHSPDIPFTQSINAYYGCEHGCIYCYARPSYAYWGLSPGLDFETKLFAKTNAAALLRRELARSGYVVSPISLGANTDPYQPVERDYKITRSILEVCEEFNQPVGIITKSSLVERDIDILARMARHHLAKVFVSCASLDADLARTLEPRAAAPYRRIETIKRLAGAGVPVGILAAPVIPMLNDATLEAALEAAHAAGAREAGYVLLRLPHELKDLFKDWLDAHFPARAAHVMSLVRQSRGGRENDSTFGNRMKGEGVFADMIAQRFKKACARLGLNARDYALDVLRFAPPASAVARGVVQGVPETRRAARLAAGRATVKGAADAKLSAGSKAENGSGSGPQMSLF